MTSILKMPLRQMADHKAPGGKAFEAIAAFIKSYEADKNTLPSENEITRATGASTSTVHTVSAVFRAMRATEDLTAPIRFTKAQDAHIEARVKFLDRIRERNFEARVIEENQRQIKSLFPDLEKLQTEARQNEKYYREQIERVAIFTEAEYRDILLCTHEANPSEETRKRAFMALNGKKLQLTGKK